METSKISIIVPIYNAEKYMDETIKTAINQTLKNIEIILVNDGSTDNSKKICEKYAKQDKRIIVVNKQNGGLADARNAGMEKATGKYMMFLDADDLFEIDSCEHMYNTIEKTKADYVIGNYQMIEEDGTRYTNTAFDQKEYETFKLNKNDFKKSFFVMNSTAWNKIYNTEFLRKNNITFKVPSPEEDNYFTSLCFIKANYGFYTNKVIYLYRNAPNSLSKVYVAEYFKRMNYSYKAIYEMFLENNEMNYYRYLYAKKNAYLLCQIIDSEQMDDNEKVNCLKDFEWYFSLSEELKIHSTHETLRKVMDLVHKKDYDNAIVEMNKLKIYRKDIPDNIKKRMSFPTRANYEEMEKYDQEFVNQGENQNV